MAQLVIMMADVNSADVYKDVKLFKRGDVIEVADDDAVFSAFEQAHRPWRILKFPHVSVSEARALLSRELPVAPQLLSGVPDPMLQVRGFYLDVDMADLPVAMRIYLDDDTRDAPAYEVPGFVSLAAMKRQRPARADPFVIG